MTCDSGVDLYEADDGGAADAVVVVVVAAVVAVLRSVRSMQMISD